VTAAGGGGACSRDKEKPGAEHPAHAPNAAPPRATAALPGSNAAPLGATAAPRGRNWKEKRPSSSQGRRRGRGTSTTLRHRSRRGARRRKGEAEVASSRRPGAEAATCDLRGGAVRRPWWRGAAWFFTTTTAMTTDGRGFFSEFRRLFQPRQIQELEMQALFEGIYKFLHKNALPLFWSSCRKKGWNLEMQCSVKNKQEFEKIRRMMEAAEKSGISPILKCSTIMKNKQEKKELKPLNDTFQNL
ncbi:hypothetical protein PIB30_084652, partial [Stylosanthes scabra]|nr:hypothetical protein [Stylosanthes scabra]